MNFVTMADDLNSCEILYTQEEYARNEAMIKILPFIRAYLIYYGYWYITINTYIGIDHARISAVRFVRNII